MLLFYGDSAEDLPYDLRECVVAWDFHPLKECSMVLGYDLGCSLSFLPRPLDFSWQSLTADRQMLTVVPVTHFSSVLLGMFTLCFQSNPPFDLHSRRICLLYQIATSICTFTACFF